jgi:phage protein U
MRPLLALGSFVFRVLPLTLQQIDEESSANHPPKQRFGRGPYRQFTGPGEATQKIGGLIFDEEFGGYGEYIGLKAMQATGTPVMVVSWGGGAASALVLGRMCILKVGAVHTSIGEGGIGRKIAFSVELARAGDDGPAGGLF